MVGTTGFEPATSRTPSVRATRLRYVPTACTVCSVSLAFEKGQDGEQFFVQIEQKFALSLRGSFAAGWRSVSVCGGTFGAAIASSGRRCCSHRRRVPGRALRNVCARRRW